MNYGELLISKVIELNQPNTFQLYGIKRHHFQTEAERLAFDFIQRHVKTNRQCPDYRTLVANIEADFTYMPNVKDSFEYLARELKNYSAKVKAAKLIEKELQGKFDTLNGTDFLKWLQEESENIMVDSGVKTSIGKSLTELKDEMKEEYLARKQGKSFKLWKTPFPSLNKEIGGFFSSDIYGIFAESGRGKSYLTIAIVDELLRQGANVLVKSFELKSYLWLSRLISIITARHGVLKNDFGQIVGLENSKILQGNLDSEVWDYEKYFMEVLAQIDSHYPGKLYLQCKGDVETTRSLDDLERELTQYPEIDVVIVDAFYGLTDVYGKNTNKTTGGAAEQAARRFEVICGNHDVAGIYTIQATIEKTKEGEEGQRMLKLPKREQLKTTKALIDIATVLMSYDSCDGIAKIGIEKGRNGGEDFEVELLALMDYGVMKEPMQGEDINAHFDMSNF